MSQSGRNLIAQVLARRALMGGAGAAGGSELRPMFGSPTQWIGRDFQRLEMERRRTEQDKLPPELLMPSQPLYVPDWVPADQPTSEETEGYYMKRRL